LKFTLCVKQTDRGKRVKKPILNQNLKKQNKGQFNAAYSTGKKVQQFTKNNKEAAYGKR
jgi:hypothetical protein